MSNDYLLHLGPSGYVSRDDNQVTDIDYTQDFSVEAIIWKEPNERHASFANIVRKGIEGIEYSAGAKGWRLGMAYHAFYRWWSNDIYFGLCDGSNRVDAYTTSDPGWVYAIGTWDKTTKVATIYVNNRVASGVNTSIVSSGIDNSQPLLMGKVIYGGLNADIAMARMWNRKLSATEASGLYSNWLNTRNPVRYGGLNASGLISEWLMNVESSSSGTNGTGYVKDNIGSNHLQLLNNATLNIQPSGYALAPYAPADEARNIGSSTYLEVQGGRASLNYPSGTLQYYFEVAEDDNFSVNSRNSGWQSHKTTWRPTLKPNTTYYWRAKCKDINDNVSNYITRQSFTTRSPKTWFVRPLTTAGSYGREDGVDYNNAFNGLVVVGSIVYNFNDTRGIKWGTGGVEAGDTLYVCGVHQPAQECDSATLPTAYLCYIPIDGYSSSYPVTLRGDYRDDNALLWYFNKPLTEPIWRGPDSNNVYYITDLYSAPFFENINNRSGIWMRQASDFASPGVNTTIADINTWTTNGAAWHYNAASGLTFFKTHDNTSPSGKLWVTGGYTFVVNRRSNITFKNIEFRGFPSFVDAHTIVSDPSGGFPYATHITWDGCVIRYGTRMISPYYSNDYWTLNECTLEYGQAGVYGIAGSPDPDFKGPDYTTVTKCTIEHMGTKDFPDIDGHAIGSQACNNCLIDSNYCNDTGSSIVLYTSALNMKNNIISNNIIENTVVIRGFTGLGIYVGGDNTSVTGIWTGNVIKNNIINNSAYNGIQSDSNDPIEIYGNKINNCANIAFDFAPVQGYPKHTLRDNFVNGASGYYLYAGGNDALDWTTVPFSMRHCIFRSETSGLKFYWQKTNQTVNVSGMSTILGYDIEAGFSSGTLPTAALIPNYYPKLHTPRINAPQDNKSYRFSSTRSTSQPYVTSFSTQGIATIASGISVNFPNDSAVSGLGIVYKIGGQFSTKHLI